MTVRVITDSAASLPPEIAAELDITVIDLHVMDSEDKGGKLRTTSGLSSSNWPRPTAGKWKRHRMMA